MRHAARGPKRGADERGRRCHAGRAARDPSLAMIRKLVVENVAPVPRNVLLFLVCIRGARHGPPGPARWRNRPARLIMRPRGPHATRMRWVDATPRRLWRTQLQFLRVIAAHSDANKMTAANLARMFVPNLLWEVNASGSLPKADTEAVDSPHMVALLTTMIEDYDLIFAGVAAPPLYAFRPRVCLVPPRL